jgi:quercetin 2,3-dioxygenase
MREPQDRAAAADAESGDDEDPHALLVMQSRSVDVAGFPVRRALPQRGRRTVGAWCFADHLGPMESGERRGLDVGPHPHMGLQTVTWLVEGEVLHRDSLGSEQLIRPGQLNLMTASNGIAHAEESTDHYQGRLHGIQLWIAQPEATRHTTPAFEHFDELPSFDLDGATATVLVGSIGSEKSGARHDTELIGIELALRKSTTVSLREDFEYALVVLEGTLHIGARALSAGQLGYLRAGRDEVTIDVTDPARAMLLGGSPFEEEILMWWNFVARTHEEVDAAYRSWEQDDGRFGSVTSSLDRIMTRRPLWQQASPN